MVCIYCIFSESLLTSPGLDTYMMTSVPVCVVLTRIRNVPLGLPCSKAAPASLVMVWRLQITGYRLLPQYPVSCHEPERDAMGELIEAIQLSRKLQCRPADYNPDVNKEHVPSGTVSCECLV